MTDTQSTRLVNPSPVETLYRLRSMNGDLLYVGITTNWPQRMKQHQAEKPWWSEVANVELVRVFGTRGQIEAIEKAVIKNEAPTYNVAHNGLVRKVAAKVVALPDNGVELYGAWFRRGDSVFTFGRVATLVDWHPEDPDLDYTVWFSGEDWPVRIDGTCHIRHAIPGEQDEIW